LSELPNRKTAPDHHQQRPEEEEKRSDDRGATHGVHVPDRGRREDAGLGRGLRERSRGPGDGIEVDYRGHIKVKLDVSQGTGQTGRRAKGRDTDDLP
jgi:hypothetical protein